MFPLFLYTSRCSYDTYSGAEFHMNVSYLLYLNTKRKPSRSGTIIW